MRIYILLFIVLLLNIAVHARKLIVNKPLMYVIINTENQEKEKKDKDQTQEKAVNKANYFHFASQKENSHVKISPQPVEGLLHIDNFDFSGRSLEISIINIIGVTVYSGKSHTINMENIPSGLYILMIKEGDTISSTKFYKK